MFLSCSFCFACKMTHGKQEKFKQKKVLNNKSATAELNQKVRQNEPWKNSPETLVHTKTKVQHQQQPILPEVEGDLAVALVLFFH